MKLIYIYITLYLLKNFYCLFLEYKSKTYFKSIKETHRFEFILFTKIRNREGGYLIVEIIYDLLRLVKTIAQNPLKSFVFSICLIISAVFLFFLPLMYIVIYFFSLFFLVSKLFVCYILNKNCSIAFDNVNICLGEKSIIFYFIDVAKVPFFQAASILYYLISYRKKNFT